MRKESEVGIEEEEEEELEEAEEEEVTRARGEVCTLGGSTPRRASMLKFLDFSIVGAARLRGRGESVRESAPPPLEL